MCMLYHQVESRVPRIILYRVKHLLMLLNKSKLPNSTHLRELSGHRNSCSISVCITRMEKNQGSCDYQIHPILPCPVLDTMPLSNWGVSLKDTGNSDKIPFMQQNEPVFNFTES